MQELSHYINGTHVKGGSGRFADVFNPATGEVQARVPLASKDELDAAVAKAAEAQVAWGATNPQKRGRVLMEIGAPDQPRHGQAGRGALAASMARPFPTPRATCSAVLRSSNSASARRTC